MRRILVAAAAPVVAALSVRPLADRIATRLMDAPRRLPEEAGMTSALDALGGEVVRLRARDGVRLTGRWLAADPGAPGAAGDDAAPDAAPAWTPDPREAILLLHGWSGSATPDLVEMGPFLRRTAGVLGLDFRGHGGSDDGPTTFGLLEVEDVAGALAWLGERGISRVALVGSSMGGVTAIAAVAVLGDGRLPSADLDPAAPVSPGPPPRPRIIAVVADSVEPELEPLIARRIGRPLGRLLAGRAFGRVARRVGGDPRQTQPIAMIGLLEELPLLLVHLNADPLIPLAEGRRLAAAAPPGARHLVIEGAGHGAAHAADPARYEAEVGALLRGAFAAARA